MFRRKKPPEPVETATADIGAAKRDLLKADEQQTTAKVENHRARWASESLRKVREENHFAPAIRRSMLGEI